MTRTTVDSILLAALAGFLGAGCGPVTAPEPRTTVPAGAAPASATGAAEETVASDDGTRQRNIVRKKLPKGMNSIALEYTVVLVDDGGGQKAVDPAEHTFAVGDSFLVRIRPQDDLYVYVFNEGPQGKRVCLLPAADEKPQLVRAGTDITLPDDGSYFTFEPPAGEEKLLVVALPQATDDIRLLATSVFKGQSEALRTEEATAARRAGRFRPRGPEEEGGRRGPHPWARPQGGGAGRGGPRPRGLGLPRRTAGRRRGVELRDRRVRRR